MSIKDLFGKTSKDLEETVQDVESVKFVEEKSKKQERYLPPVDFSDPKNFVYYGSAELYYDAAFRRIYEDYPYDGSKSEQIEFEEKSSHLERWLFENRYPKTTGYIELGTSGNTSPVPSSPWASTTVNEYIRVWGGLHTDGSTQLQDKFAKSAKYDADKNRNQNWNCDFNEGITVEFWLKKDNFDLSREVILDLWNGEDVSNPNYGRVILALGGSVSTTSHFHLTLMDTTVQITSTPLDFSSWHHYSLSIVKEDFSLIVRLYVDGNQVGDSFNFPLTVIPDGISGKIDGFIGALQHEDYNGDGGQGYGKLSAHLDEFRFWKTERSARQIKLNWFSQVGGGANTDDATSDLGVYFKFNEGIVGNSVTDSVILDYSGRLANGLWVGYPGSSARNTSSAIEAAGYTEPATPIIYSNHPEITALSAEMQESGSFYDAERGQAFYNSMPTWLQQEDNGNLRQIAQILGSYLDTLHVQIKQMTELKNKDYTPEGLKASTMAQDLLKDKGFLTSNIFGMNEVYEKLSDLDIQDNQFESDLNEIKNTIYTNIYNNLEKIYKSKGTETSIRNFIRCFGIDDELVKLNLYTDGGVQYLSDKSRVTSVKKKYINFNHPNHFSATIYQTSSADNTNTFIDGSSTGTNASNNAFTLEADIVVPYKKEKGENGYFGTPFLSSSVFGFHQANEADETDYSWSGDKDLQVHLVRDSAGSNHAKFVLKNEAETIYQESDYIYDIYDNEHYNIAIRIKPQTYPYAGGVTNTTPDYDIEMYAVTNNLGEIKEEALLTQTVGFAIGSAYMNVAKRVYAGAHRQDFMGSVLQKSDVQIGSIRGWLDYLGDEEIQNHNKDVLNYGSRRSIDGSNIYTVDGQQIPTHDLTILNWDFDTVLASDGSGQFIVEDITSGSIDTIYGWVDDIIRREHRAQGDFFPSEDSSFLSNEFLYSLKKQLPETAYNSENIFIKGEQEINFSDDDDVSDNLFILEKSPANLVSEEMLKSFSTTMEFANLVGRPIDRYRLEYKDLAKARELFFNKVESDLDFDRFFEYFKWIDSSISSMVNQLIPLSANFAGGIVDVIEPHILERDKYQRQIGLLSTVTSTEASIRGVQELNYNWKFGHAPLSEDEADHCLWQKERKERETSEGEQLREVFIRQNDQEFTNPINLSGSDGAYSGSYAVRRFSRPYSLGMGFSHSIHGGINYDKNKDRDFLSTVVRPNGALGDTGAPENIMTIGAGIGNGLNPVVDCNDVLDPNELIKRDGFAQVGKFSDLNNGNPKTDEGGFLYRRKISQVFPGNIVSSSVNTGYSSIINRSTTNRGFGIGLDVVNLHSDTTDITNEIPMQGPFSQQWLGGHQSRHVDINKVGRSEWFPNELDNQETRPEAWRFLVGEYPQYEVSGDNLVDDNDGAIGFTGPDYGGQYPISENQKAIYYREDRVKRPVNIRNIKTIIGSGSAGNYVRGYEFLSTFGDQKYFLRRHADENLLPSTIAESLPQTTNYYTLIAQTGSAAGNVFGPETNRWYSNVSDNSPTALFRIHEDSNLGNPPATTPEYFDSSQYIKFLVTRPNGATGASSINFAVHAMGDPLQLSGDTTLTLEGDLCTIINTDGITWPTFGAEIEKAITHPTNGFGSNVSVNITYQATSAEGKSVLVELVENEVPATGEVQGIIIFSVASPGGSRIQHIDGIRLSFLGDYYNFNNIVPTQNRSIGSINTIRTKFSAPGGPEVNTSGYLDIATQQYSVHNSINFRNLTVRASGSGEYHEDNAGNILQSTIRVNSHSNRREGLRTLRARHQGQFGIDSQHGAISATDYVTEASFHKQHRNNIEKITPVDAASRGMRFANSENEYLEIASLHPDGEVDIQNGALSLSFWMKLDTTIGNIGIIDGTNFKLFYSGGEFKFRFKNTFTSFYGAQFDVSSFNLLEWNHFVVSLRIVDNGFGNGTFIQSKMSVGGQEAPYATPQPEALIYAVEPLQDQFILGRADSGVLPTKYVLQGSIMNFAYFDSFIHDDPEALAILADHTRRYEIDNIRSLVNFWFLGEETSLSSGDPIENGLELKSAYGRYTETFTTVVPASPVSNVEIVDGFYSYIAGVREGDQVFNNDHYTSLLPASAFQYSWINSTLSGSDHNGVTWESRQRIIGHAPRSGQVAIVGEGYVDAIVFPTISDIPCEENCDEETIIELCLKHGEPGNQTEDCEDFSLEVTQGSLDLGPEQIYEGWIGDIAVAASYSGCCPEDSLEYFLKYWEVSAGSGSAVKIGPFSATPPAPAIEYYNGEPPEAVILEYSVEDCEGTNKTIRLTLVKARLIP